MARNGLVYLRVLIGAVFVVSGFEKLMGPYQNFLYVIQSYALFPAPAEEMAARIFPWVEFFLGVFLVSGLWLDWALAGVMVMLATFIVVVGQAILRGLPIDECGCFGDLISFSLRTVILFDSLVFILTALMYRKKAATGKFSLDGYFNG